MVPSATRLNRRHDLVLANHNVAKLRAENPQRPVPVDLVATSGSGLDPDISPAAAEFQVPRVVRERNMSEQEVRELVRRESSARQLGVLGEPRVNVLLLNLSLDDQKSAGNGEPEADTSNHR